MSKSKEKVKGLINKSIKLMNTPLMSILPGQISFFVILSIIPLASIFVMIISKLSFNYMVVTNFIYHYLPNSIANVIIMIFEQQKAGAFDIIFIITAFYLASKSTHSIIVASTQIYNGKQQDFVRTRVKAIIMLLILMSLITGLISVLMIGSKLIGYLGDQKYIYEVMRTTYNILKWPFVFFMVFFSIKIIYTIAPNTSIPSASVNKGALLTTVVWVLSTYIYSFYVTNIANYNKFYGNLSNLIILMIWIYFLSYIFVFGMTFNEYRLYGEKKEKDKSLD